MSEQWIIFENGKQKTLNNLDYLNYLLKRSEKAIKDFNKREMQYVIWDLEEFEDNTSLFYTLNKLTIESEIKTLSRLIQYDLIR